MTTRSKTKSYAKRLRTNNNRPCIDCLKINQSFRGYEMSYKIEIIERKYPIVQLETSKSSIKDLFSNLLNETKGLKYQITVKALLKKYKLNGEIEFAPVYFN